MSSLFDPTAFSITAELSRRQRQAALDLSTPTIKEAFTPSPAVAQAVMAQTQGGPPPGMDPTGGMGGMGGQGMPVLGPDPSAGGGAVPPPAGVDPAVVAQGAPPPAGGTLDPALVTAIQQAVRDAMSQGGQSGAPGGGPGAAGAGGKVNKDQIIHQIAHDISVLKHVNKQLAGALGLQIPAEDLFNVHPHPTSPGAGTGGAAGDPAAQAAGADPSQAGGGPTAPPSQIAIALPALPPVASKAAAAKTAGDNRLSVGIPVSPLQGNNGSPAATMVALIHRLKKPTRV